MVSDFLKSFRECGYGLAGNLGRGKCQGKDVKTRLPGVYVAKSGSLYKNASLHIGNREKIGMDIALPLPPLTVWQGRILVAGYRLKINIQSSIVAEVTGLLRPDVD